MVDKRANAQAERRISATAAASHGIITVAELFEAGLVRNGVSRRVSSARLFRIHRGVYSTVPPELLTSEGRWLAAVKACGEGAVLSHMSAAALWDLAAAFVSPIHVIIPTDGGRSRRSGIAIHRSSNLLPSHTTIKAGIPVTKPDRTLRDLRRVVSPQRLEALVRRAERLRLDTGGILDVLPEPGGSSLERRFLALCRRHGTPLPRTQELIGPYHVDFLWPAARLVAEVDGFESHGLRSSFEADRARDAWLIARGYTVVRFTWRQVTGDPAHVVNTLRALLA